MDNTLPPAPGKKRSSFFKRAGCGCLGLFFLLALALWVFGGSLVHHSIEEMAQQELGLPISIGEVKLSLLGRPSISFRNLVFGNKEELLLKVKELTVSLSWDERAFLLVLSDPLLTLTPEMWEPGSSLQRLVHTLLASNDHSKESLLDGFAIPLLRIDGGRIFFTTPDKQSGTISIRSLSATNLASPDHSFALRPQQLELTDMEVTHSSDIFKIRLNKGTIERTKTLASSAFSSSLGDLFLSDLIHEDGSRASQQLLASFSRLQVLLFPSSSPVSGDSALQHWEIKDSTLASLHLSLLFKDRPGITCVFSGLQLEQAQSDPTGVITINALNLQNGGGTITSPTSSDTQVNFDLTSWGVSFFSFSPSTRVLSFNPFAGRTEISLSSGKEEESLSLDSFSGDFEKNEGGILLRHLALGKSTASLEIRKHRGMIFPERLSLLVTEWLKLFPSGNQPPTEDLSQSGENSAFSALDMQNITFKGATLNLRDTSSPEDGLFVSLALSNGSLTSLYHNSQAHSLGELKVQDSSLSFTQGKNPLLSLSLKDWTLPRLALSASTRMLPEILFSGSHLITHIGRETSGTPVLLLDQFSVHLLPSAPSALQMESCILKDANIQLTLSAPGVIQQQRTLEMTNQLIYSYLLDSTKDQTKPVTPLFNTLSVKSLTTEGLSLQLSAPSSSQPMATHQLSWKDQDIQMLALSLSQDGLIEQFSTESISVTKLLVNYSDPKTTGLRLSVDSLSSTPFTYPFEKDKPLDRLSLKECLLSSLGTKESNPYLHLRELSLRLQSLSPLHIIQMEGSGVKLALSYDTGRDKWDIQEDSSIFIDGLNEFLDWEKGALLAQTRTTNAPFAINQLSLSDMQLQLSTINNERPAVIKAQFSDLKGYNLGISGDRAQPTWQTKELSVTSVRAEFPGDESPLQLSSNSLSFTNFDSLHLVEGRSALSFLFTELRTGDLSSPGNSPQVYIPSLQGSLRELSKQKIVLEDISCDRPSAKMTLREDKSIDLFSLPSEFLSVARLFFPANSVDPTPSSQRPVLLERFSVNQGQLLLTDHFSSRDKIVEVYDFSQIWLRGANLDFGGSSKGRFAAGALAGLVNDQGILPGTISLEAEELLLPLARNQASFTLSARLERIPVQLIAPAILQLQEIQLTGDKGSISLSSTGSSTFGELSFPVDLEFQGILGKSVKSTKQDKANSLTSLLGSLKEGAQGVLFTIFLANLTPQHKAIKNAFTIKGSLQDPKFVPNSNVIEKTGKQSLEMLIKSLPKSILRPSGTDGRESIEENDQSRIGEEEDESEEKKSSKEEEKKKQVSDLLNMGLELLKNAK